MATLLTIVTLLAFLSSLNTTESRNSPYQKENSLTREQTRNEIDEEECELRRPDGTCHNNWRVGKKGKSGFAWRERRQAKCNRIQSPNCRVMVGKKRNEYFKGPSTNTPCDKRSANCQKFYTYERDQESANLAKKKTQNCDVKSPLCFLPFPGKRKPKHDRKDLEKRVHPEETGSSFPRPLETSGEEVKEKVVHKYSVSVTDNDLMKKFLVARRITELPYELKEGKEKKTSAITTLADDSDNSKPTCDPKRDLQCRFRIFAGKRDQTINKPTYPEPY